MKLIPGKAIASQVLQKIATKVNTFDVKPKLAILQVGDDPSTNIYVSKKIEDAKAVGIDTELCKFHEISNDKLTSIIKDFNQREDITGFFLQLPFKIEGDLYSLMNLIDPKKDVDGLGCVGLGKAWQSNNGDNFLPATVFAVKKCLEYISVYEDNEFGSDELDEKVVEKKLGEYLEGKEILIINRSSIVGKPLAGVLLNYNSTVTIAHRFTKDLDTKLKKSDIIITATGKAGFITGEKVKEGSVIVDVGISKIGGFVKGDVNMESMESMDGWLTPVPDGVGPLTRALLLQNVMNAKKC